MNTPLAEVASVRTDGHRVTRVLVVCPFCRGQHVHAWHGDTDGVRAASCGAPGATYRIRIGTHERVKAMRAQFPTPDGVVGLVPMRISYAYEHDGDDVIGVVLDTALGGFAVWLELPTAVQLAAQLVEIAENADTLRQRYNTEQNRPPSPDAPPAMASLKP